VIIHGDCLEEMAKMEAESVDAIVTDPPYGLKFMGKDWDHGLPGIPFWAEALRVALPGAHLLAFGGTRTFHRLTCAIEDAGWEIRDTLGWIYGSGFPKSHNLPPCSCGALTGGEHAPDCTRFTMKQWQGWGTALKPAWEPIILARKPLIGTVAENVLKYGTGAINVEACRVEVRGDDPVNKAKWHISERTKYGKYDDQSHIGETRPMVPKGGRWPANIIHDGSDEVVGLFPQTTSGDKKAVPRRKADGDGWGMSTYRDRAGDSGSAARFFYSAKASRAEREAGLEGMEGFAAKAATLNPYKTAQCNVCGSKTKAAGQNQQGPSCGHQDWVWVEQLGHAKARNHHPTVKPLALMRYLVRLVTPPGGIVLDPFMGSGTTGMAAKLEGFEFIGIEKEKDYHEIARSRINNTEVQK